MYHKEVFKLEKAILNILEKDSRTSVEEIALMLNRPVNDIFAAIADMEKRRVICSYTTLINYDKTEREFVTAMIEVQVTPQRDMGFEKIAERIYGFDEVKAVYLMSGGYDFMILMEGKNIKEISHFISDKLSTLEAVRSTATHFVLKKYKDHGVIMDKTPDEDERMIVTP